MKINHPERYVGKRVRVVSLQGTATAGQFIGYNYDYDDNGNEFVEFDIDADFGIGYVFSEHGVENIEIIGGIKMARSPIATHACPLYNRDVTWSECCEVQEVREDEMELKWLREPFDRAQADEICTRCRWYVVSKGE